MKHTHSYNWLGLFLKPKTLTLKMCIFVASIANAQTTLIPTGASWKYLDNGSNQGTAWRATSFDDGSWASGPAQLGYGDGDEATVVNYGSNSSNKYITTYFRKTISITDASKFSGYNLNVKRDDGVVVYINGNEVYRDNMPTGSVSYTTLASTYAYDNGGKFQTVSLPASALVTGTNVIAVEIHQNSVRSSDISFDMELLGTESSGSTTIGTFTSVKPSAQTGKLVIPSTHTFQMLLQQGNSYTTGGSVPSNNDFTGYIPVNGSSTKGFVSVNHETSPGGVSIMDVHYDATSKLWVRDAVRPVSFSGATVKTERNCSGGITPWGTVITCEESTTTGDYNRDGYNDVGWHVEIDPATRTVKQYGNGINEKLWALGRMKHENIVVSSDGTKAYFGEDASSGNLYKFVPTTANNLYEGKLYVLKLSRALSNGEPVSSTGTWVVVPNTTKSDRNSTTSLASSLGATVFNGVEDVEIGPDGKIYFTSKGNGRVYRFTDNGSSVSEFQTFVGGKNYTINYGSGSVSEPWGTGNDNLAFDGEGNLWVLQDGSRNFIWVVRPTHTQASPQVALFGKTPSGGEPTGITFTPDHKYAFISIQHPYSTNGTQIDASGASVAFNRSATIVIARKEFLGNGTTVASISEPQSEDASNAFRVYPNPFDKELTVAFTLEEDANVKIKLFDIQGKEVASLVDRTMEAGEHLYDFATEKYKGIDGILFIKLIINDKVFTRKIVKK